MASAAAFRDWAAEETSFPREVAEAALAHVVGDSTERAYRRGDALEQRRRLMEAWAAFCRRGCEVSSAWSRWNAEFDTYASTASCAGT